MEQEPPLHIYQKLLFEHEHALRKLKARRRLLGWLRLIVLLLIVAALYIMWSSGLLLLTVILMIGVAVFLVVLSADQKNKALISNTETLIQINREEMAIGRHEFLKRPSGLEFLPATHEYAADLDIFGRASIFQYINRTNSEQGNALMARWLLDISSPEEIFERQLAAKELSDKIKWRQQFQAHTKTNPLTIATATNVEKWVTEANNFNAPRWKLLSYLLPGIAILSIVLSLAGRLPSPVLVPFLFVFFVYSLYISSKVMPAYDQLGKIAAQLNSLSATLVWIEDEAMNAPYLQKLKSQLGGHSVPASAVIKQLSGILNRMDYRLNPVVFIPLNTILQWDLQHALQLERWKSKYGNAVQSWFTVLSEWEAINTLATFDFNHPDYCVPGITDTPGVFIAQELGHPLLTEEQRVTSSYSTSGLTQITIITGSNMAGKSTFLRSVGVNIVLSMMGAKACAKSLTLSHQKVISSMRITDNLEENTSTFYAELKKLKDVIERVKRHEHVFLLLDEMLRGTNSLDRHTGSKALIKQLVTEHAVGIIATHDLELARLAEDHPGHISNYHFDVQVENDELFFDYKLKTGVCTSMNASILMKKIGIDL